MKVFNTPTNYPVIYQIEMTEKCNFNCPMCINDRIKQKRNASKELIDTIVDRGYLRNTLYTEFQFSGEPTIAPNLEYAIDRVRQTGVMTGLSTNLSTVRKKIDMLNKLDCLTVSLDVFDRELYEQSRFPNKFYEFKENLEFLLENISSKVLVQIQLLKTEWTLPKYEQGKMNLEAWMYYRDFSNMPNVMVREVEDCFLSYHDDANAPKNFEMCLNPFLTVSIKADGTVVPCCFDFLKDLPLGNILEDDLLDIWNGKEVFRLRNQHKGQAWLPKKCKECYARSPIIFMQNEIIPALMRFKRRPI